MRGQVTGLGMAVVVLLVAAGCRGGDASQEPVATTPASPVTVPTVSPAAPASPSSTPGGSADPAESAVAEDEGLLAILPEQVGSVPVTLEHQGFIEAVRDPAFAAGIASAVFFVVPGAEDIVSGLVAKPRPDVSGDAWYADWRETYDDGACAQAGGVGGRAEAPIGGRQVSITTCAGGMRVYHAWLEEQGVVVSLISLGEARWGEQVMGSLRP